MNGENLIVSESKEKFKKEYEKNMHTSIGHISQPERAPNGLKLDAFLHPGSVEYDVSQLSSSDKRAVGRSYTWTKIATLALDEAQNLPLPFFCPYSSNWCYL